MVKDICKVIIFFNVLLMYAMDCQHTLSHWNGGERPLMPLNLIIIREPTPNNPELIHRTNPLGYVMLC